MIVEPLGYEADSNPIDVTVDGDEIVDFSLTATVLANDARSVSYWKHQFDACVKGRAAAESEADLLAYAAEAEARYNIHFDLFDGLTTCSDWQDALSARGNATMTERARAKVGALVMNLMSLKVGQYEAGTEDGYSVGDVLTHASGVLENGTDSDDWIARDIAGTVNHQSLVAAGIVPDGDVLYRPGAAVPAARRVKNSFWLYAPAPNPASSQVVVRYGLEHGAQAAITMHDLLGREVMRLPAERHPTGRSLAVIEVSDLSPGVYVISIMDGGRRLSRSIIVH